MAETPNKVIDLMRERLVREAETSPDPRLRQASYAIVEMYDAGLVEASMVDGAVMVRLKPGQPGALIDLVQGALTEPPDPPHEGP